MAMCMCVYETHAEIVQKKEKGVLSSVVLGRNFHISNESLTLTYCEYRLLCKNFMVEYKIVINCLTLSC